MLTIRKNIIWPRYEQTRYLPARRQAERGERRDEANGDTPSEREAKGGKQGWTRGETIMERSRQDEAG